MKKVISLLLACVMLFGMAVPAFAAEESEAADYDGYSVIVVRGIDFGGLTYEDGSLALNVDIGAIFTGLFKAFGAMVFSFNKDKLMDGIFDIAYDILSPLACDNEGKSVYPVSMVQYPDALSNYPEFVANLTDGAEPGIVKTAVERYGADNTYFFSYDWRKDAKTLASELNAMVEKAKANSGKDKVNIICASMGCMVTTAYMHYYGSNCVNSAVYLSGAHNGTYVVGDCLNGRVVFKTDTLLNLVKSVTDNNLFLSVILTVFDALGVIDFTTGIINNIVAESFDKANDAVLRDCFGTLAGFWALCPDEDYDSAIETIFGDCKEEYSVLLETLAETKEFVFSTEETIQAAYDNGVKISFASHYNTGLVPVYEKADGNGDMVLETELTSNFATVARLGYVLDEEYLATADSTYVSADKIIDASTALYKDYTWFVKDAPHVAADYGTQYSEFTFWLLESETQPDVNMNEKYPRFMQTDDALNLFALKAEEKGSIFDAGC